MRTRRNRRAGGGTALTVAASLAAAAATLSLISLAGCGGGGDGGDNNGSPSPSGSPTIGPSASPSTPTSVTTNYRVNLNWAARSRQAGTGVLGGALSSAVSARIGISRSTTVNTPNGPEWVAPPFVVNRQAGPAAYAETVTSPNQVTFRSDEAQYLIVTFHAQPDGGGPLVGYAILPAAVGANSTLLGTVTAVGTIATVEVLGGQQFIVDQPADLAVTCKTASGFVIPVTPGSVFPQIAGGGDVVRIEAGRVVGTKPGTASVRAVVDGVSSLTTSVTVTSLAVTTVAPATATVSWEESQKFTATVAPAPDQSVTWRVENATAGDTGAIGTIAADGTYTAPKRPDRNPLTVRVVATSVYDPIKTGTATVTVTSLVGVTVTPNPGRVAVSKQLKMTAAVSRTADQGVTWSVANAPGFTGSPGTIAADGTYTAPGDRRTVIVTATSKYDPTKSGSALVNVEAGGADVTVD
jgi:hypothetical protein